MQPTPTTYTGDTRPLRPSRSRQRWIIGCGGLTLLVLSCFALVLLTAVSAMLTPDAPTTEARAAARPTATPELTPTPEPTLEPTPEPTAEPTPEPTPAQPYASNARRLSVKLTLELQRTIPMYLDHPEKLRGWMWVVEGNTKVSKIHATADELRALTPPAGKEAAQAQYHAAAGEAYRIIDELEQARDAASGGDTALMQAHIDAARNAWTTFQENVSDARKLAP